MVPDGPSAPSFIELGNQPLPALNRRREASPTLWAQKLKPALHTQFQPLKSFTRWLGMFLVAQQAGGRVLGTEETEELGMVAHGYYPSNQEAKARGWPEVQGQPGPVRTVSVSKLACSAFLVSMARVFLGSPKPYGVHWPTPRAASKLWQGRVSLRIQRNGGWGGKWSLEPQASIKKRIYTCPTMLSSLRCSCLWLSGRTDSCNKIKK